MAINIIEGFYLGSSTPIDSRFVVASATDRTSIVYKYDGLKVFQTDTRETWVWNSGTSTWDLEGSSNTSGSGTQNYVTKWLSSTVLGTSSLFATGSNVGINTVNPLATLQINGINNPVVIDNGSGGAIVGYNYYYSGGDQYFSSGQGSSKMLMDNNGAITFTTRNASGSFKNSLSLNNISGYNVLTSPGAGNFISGSSSFGVGVTPPSTYGDLVVVDGSFRTNSSVSKNVKYLYYNGPLGVGIGGNYIVQPSDHELIIKSFNSALFYVTLPISTNSNIGREIVITLESTTQPSSLFVVQSTSNIIGLDGSVISPIIKVGETIRLISYGTFWKVMQNAVQFKSDLLDSGYISTQTTGTNNYETLHSKIIQSNTLVSSGDILRIFAEFYCGLGYSGTNTNLQQLCDIRLNGVSFTQFFSSPPDFVLKFSDVDLQIYDINICLTRLTQTTAKFDIYVETLKNFGSNNLSVNKFINGSFSSSKLTGSYTMSGIDFSTNMNLTFIGKTANGTVQQVHLNNVRVEVKNT